MVESWQDWPEAEPLSHHLPLQPTFLRVENGIQLPGWSQEAQLSSLRPMSLSDCHQVQQVVDGYEKGQWQQKQAASGTAGLREKSLSFIRVCLAQIAAFWGDHLPAYGICPRATCSTNPQVQGIGQQLLYRHWKQMKFELVGSSHAHLPDKLRLQSLWNRQARESPTSGKPLSQNGHSINIWRLIGLAIVFRFPEE